MKMFAKYLKMRLKMAPNVGRITCRPFFGGHPKNDVWEEMLTQRVAQQLFGELWGNSGKNLSHPQNLPATPMRWSAIQEVCGSQ